jgi:biopolymer transport protein ExbB
MVPVKCRYIVVALLAVVIIGLMISIPATAQESDPSSQPVDPNDNTTVIQGDDGTRITQRKQGLNFLNLLVRGGWFMVPLAALSVIVIAISLERMMALRERKILPRRLIHELSQMSSHHGGFDPRIAYRLCQVYPSSGARVIQAMLLKIGRPQSEVEHAVSEASQREANRLAAVVSWLTLAAAVAPLIGLLGTVWGMIQAFYDTTQLGPAQNKAEVLASGIYTALVTTLCGLMIAIPAAVLAHIFENRIMNWFHRIDEMLASIMPQVERYEGQVRFGNIPNDGQSHAPTAEPARPRKRADAAIVEAESTSNQPGSEN